MVAAISAKATVTGHVVADDRQPGRGRAIGARSMKTEGVVEADLPGLQHAWLVDPLAASAADIAIS